MKLKYKYQKFQADAAKAVVDVFAGQPYLTPSYMMDRGDGSYQVGLEEDKNFTGWSNHKIVPQLSDGAILEHIRKIQRANQLKPSDKLEGRTNGYNLSIEMETGVGKTYTYCTDDGSAGIHGFVTQPFTELAEQGGIDAVYACGPMPMLKGIAAICKEKNIYCEISLEERMACGIGACLGCACRTVRNDEEYFAHVCKDGPVFKAEEVLW